jgi:hypothetical protein
VLGFAGMTEEAIEGAVRRMASILRPLVRSEAHA